MRRVFSVLLAAVVLLFCAAAPAMAQGSKAFLDGRETTASVVTIDGVEMLPVRALADAVGGHLLWDQQTNTVSFHDHSGVGVITLTPGSTSAKVNGEAVLLEAPATIQDGQLYVPASFLRQVYGGRLSVFDPERFNPSAMRLLNRAVTVTPSNLDVLMKETVKVQAAGAVLSSLELQSIQQIRGADFLQVMTMVSPESPDQQLQVAMAFRNGRLFIADGVEWTEVGTGGSGTELGVADAEVSATGAASVFPFLSGAKLGSVKWVDGTPYRDIAIQFDPAIFNSVVQTALASGLSEAGGQLQDLTWSKLDGTITIDMSSQTMVGYSLDAVAAITVSSTEGKFNFGMEIHQSATFTPNTAPIHWPGSIPE